MDVKSLLFWLKINIVLIITDDSGVHLASYISKIKPSYWMQNWSISHGRQCILFARSVDSFFNISFNNIKQRPGGRLNKKDGLTRYGDSHVKDKTS